MSKQNRLTQEQYYILRKHMEGDREILESMTVPEGVDLINSAWGLAFPITEAHFRSVEKGAGWPARGRDGKMLPPDPAATLLETLEARITTLEAQVLAQANTLLDLSAKLASGHFSLQP